MENLFTRLSVFIRIVLEEKKWQNLEIKVETSSELKFEETNQSSSDDVLM